MLYNIMMAVSNLTCILPIYCCYTHQDYISMCCIGSLSIFSMISHLIENHKHGMMGIPGISKEQSILFNRLDVLFCYIVIFRLLYLCNYGMLLSQYYFMTIIPCCALMVISEYDKYNIQLQTRYLITHSIWHFTVFLIMNKFLRLNVYSK